MVSSRYEWLIKAWLETVTYKPMYQLDISFDWAGGQALLRVTVQTIDTYRGGHVQVAHAFSAGTDWLVDGGFDYFVGWVRDCLHRVETHEADEWLKVNGVMVFDPHRPRDAERPRLEFQPADR